MELLQIFSQTVDSVDSSVDLIRERLQLIAFKQLGELIRVPDVLQKCTVIAIQKTDILPIG